jgi:hypothetical protein
MLDLLSSIDLYSHGHLVSTSLGTQTHVDIPFDLNMVLNNSQVVTTFKFKKNRQSGKKYIILLKVT